MGIGIILLTFQHSVNHSIVHFIALHVIAEVSEFYFEALKGNNIILKGLEEFYPKFEKRGADIVFSERSGFHMVARVVYKVTRLIYVSCIFYFIPFAGFIIQFLYKYPNHGETGASEERRL